LLRNTLYNLLGLGLPLFVAIVTIPVLIVSLGLDRFGILTLIWAVVSYFGLLDLGMGRALTRHLAESWAQGDQEQAKRLVSTGLAVMAGLGIGVGILLALGAEWSLRQFSGDINQRETVNAVYAMSAAIPFIIVTSGLRGILEARQAFAVVNAIRLPMGVYTFVAPVIVVKYWENDLGLIAVSLTLGRIVACLAHAWFCYRLLPYVRNWLRIDRSIIKVLFHTGKWMTVSNLLNPLTVYLDRFVIGLTISLSAVAYYVTPYEIVTKLWIIPGALTAVLFPRFAEASISSPVPAPDLFRRGVILLFLVIYPISLGIVLFSLELLTLWLDAEFAEHSYRFLQVFSFGILVNSIAHVPFAFLQGVGRSDRTGRIHAIEFPVYALMLWGAAQTMGLPGVISAWLLRVLADSLLLFYFALKEMKGGIKGVIDWKLSVVMALAAISFAGLFVPDNIMRLLVWTFSIFGSYVLCWHMLFSTDDRAALLKRLGYTGD
jgi:O-antigen/teichoic acid export membrane protein